MYTVMCGMKKMLSILSGEEFINIATDSHKDNFANLANIQLSDKPHNKAIFRRFRLLKWVQELCSQQILM